MARVVAIILLLSMFVVGYAAQGHGQTAEPYNIVKLDSWYQAPEQIYPGDTVIVTATIKNVANITFASDLNISLTAPQEFIPIATSSYLESLAPNTKYTLVFKLRAAPSIPQGKYVATLRIDYLRKGFTATATDYLTLTVVPRYGIKLTNVEADKYELHVDNDFTLSASILNSSSTEVHDVWVELSLVGSTGLGNFIIFSDSRVEVGDMPIGGERQVSFKLKASDKLTPGVYTFQISASCQECHQTVAEKVSLLVRDSPKVIISGIDFSVEGKKEKKVVQGDAFSFSVQLDNVGKEKAEQVQVLLETDPNIFGQKKAFVGNIDPDDSSAAIFDLLASSHAPPGEHTFRIYVFYYDAEGNQRKIVERYVLAVNERASPGIEVPLGMGIVILFLIYMILKLIFRQLAMRKL